MINHAARLATFCGERGGSSRVFLRPLTSGHVVAPDAKGGQVFERLVERSAG